MVFLQPFLAGQGIKLQAIELFGQGSPYSFDHYDDKYQWWTCLFPDQSAHELSKEDIAAKLFTALDDYQPDLVIASPITFFAGALGLRWAKKNQKKFIMFDDAKPLIQFKRNFLVKWVRNTLTAQADALWLPSVDYDTEYPALKNKDVQFFYGFSCVDNAFFKSDGLRKVNCNTIVCVARLVPIKNIDNLLKAWQLVERESNYKLQIIGDGPLRDNLTQLSAQLNLKQVEFLRTVDNSTIPACYHKADALVLPSLSETWGLVVNEAMAAGLPVLLSNRINAAQSLLKEGVNGFSFDPFNVDEMANAILNYINLDNSQKEEMSARSTQIVDDMGYEQMGAQLLKALPQIAQKDFEHPNMIARIMINLWYGKHDISAWDKL